MGFLLDPILGACNRPGGAEGSALFRELPWCKMGDSAVRFGGCQMVKSLGSPFRDLWIFMDIYGYLWIFMDIYGYLWIFMDIYGHFDR